MSPKLFLTDIIGSHVYGWENSLLEQSVIRLNSLPRQHTGDAMAEELSEDIPYHTTETTVLLREAESKTSLLLIALFKYLKGFSSFLPSLRFTLPFIYMNVCVSLSMHECLQRPEESIRSPSAGVTGSSETSNMGVEN